MSNFSSDPKRDASDTIRGFLYQIQLTVIAWLNLKQDELLYCECGEDIDHVKKLIQETPQDEERILEQIKALSSNITLRSLECLTALARFREHIVRNTDTSIKLIYWFSTTAKAGKENAVNNIHINFPKNLSGIEAWQKIEENAFTVKEETEFVLELRKFIESTDRPPKLEEKVFLEFKEYIKSTDPGILIDKFIKKFSWRTRLDQPETLDNKIKNILITEKAYSNEEAEQLTDALICYVLHFITQKGEKKLTNINLADFLEKRQLPDYTKALLITVRSLILITEKLSDISSKIDNIPKEVVSLLQQNNDYRDINWRKCCQLLLEKQKKPTINSLIFSDGITKNFDEIFIPLGLTKREQKSKIDDILQKETEQEHRDKEEENPIEKTYHHTEFFEEVLKKGNSKSNGKRLAIIGEPGAGKTTLLQKVADWILKDTGDIPILIFLGNLKGKDLKEYLFGKWLEDVAIKATVDDKLKKDFEGLFHSKRVWLLLDGVDEIGKEATTVLKEIKDQIVGLLGEAKIILTCRTNVWDADKNSLNEFDTFKSLDFSYGDSESSNQVKQFIDNWFSDSKEFGNQLIQELNKPGKERLKDIARNPLMLALLCTFWQSGEQKLPDTKAILYKRFVERIYKWKSDTLSIKDEQKEDLTKFLSYLAKLALEKTEYPFRLEHSFMRKRIKELKQSNILNIENIESVFELTQKIGLLNNVGVAIEDSDEKIYTFIHPTFQEYFASQEFEKWNEFFVCDGENQEKGKYYIFDKQWQEVIILWFGRKDIPVQEKEAFMEALIEFQDGCGGFYEHQTYFLASKCLGEYKEFSKADLIVKHIIELSYGYNDQQQRWQQFPLPVRRGAFAALRQTNHRKATPVLLRLAFDEDVEIADDIASMASSFSIGNMDIISKMIEILGTSSNNDVRRRAMVTLSRIAVGNTDAISTIVSIIDNTKNEDELIEAMEVLSNIAVGNAGAINTLIHIINKSQNNRILKMAPYCLGKIGFENKDVIRTLIELLNKNQDGGVVYQSLYALEKIGSDDPQVIETFIRLMHTKHAYSRASDSLEKIAIGKVDIIMTLINMLLTNEENEHFYSSIIPVLHKIAVGNINAINALAEALSSSNERICQKCAWILGGIALGNSKAIDALANLLKTNKNSRTLRIAAYNLGVIDPNNVEAITTLVKLLDPKEDYNVRSASAHFLGNIGHNNQDAINALIALLDIDTEENCLDNSNELFEQAIWSLCEIGTGNQKVIDTFIDLLYKEQKSKVQKMFDYNLQRIAVNNLEAIHTLSKLIHKIEDKDICKDIITTLGFIADSNPEAISSLVNLTYSTEDEDILSSVAWSLGKIGKGNIDAIKCLTRLVQNRKAIKWAVWGLQQIAIGNLHAINILIDLLNTNDDNEILQDGTDSLAVVGSGNTDAISVLIKLLINNKDKDVRWHIIHGLEKNVSGDSNLVKELIKFSYSCEDSYIHSCVLHSLEGYLKASFFPLMIIGLKNYLQDSTYENKQEYYVCYELIWHCSQNMSYPEFYKAWHSTVNLESYLS